MTCYLAHLVDEGAEHGHWGLEFEKEEGWQELGARFRQRDESRKPEKYSTHEI